MGSLERKNARNTALLCIGVVSLALGLISFLALNFAQEGQLEGIFPWQILKMRYLLAASGAWFVLAGSTLLHAALLRPGETSRSASPGSD